MTLSSDLLDRVRIAFDEAYDAAPHIAVQAPARVNLIGEHTDYNDGFVLPCAIDYQTIVCARPRSDGLINVVAADYGNETDSFSRGGVIARHPTMQWANYVRGVVDFLRERAPFNGADLAIGGNVPQGAGLSSSASLEVAIGQAFKSLYDLPLSQTDLALNGQKAENLFVGCNCGIMDQLISAEAQTGAALLIDCRSLVKKPVAIPDGVTVMIVNSNVRRGLVESEYNTRRKQCEEAARFFGVKALRDVTMAQIEAAQGLDPLVLRRARHVVSENARTVEAADALAANDMIRLAALMAQSHASMREDFEITHPAVDALVDIIKRAIGEKGGVRMTGGGFGGCVVALLPDALVAEARSAVETEYEVKTGLAPALYICRPQAGAGPISL